MRFAEYLELFEIRRGKRSTLRNRVSRIPEMAMSAIPSQRPDLNHRARKDSVPLSGRRRWASRTHLEDGLEFERVGLFALWESRAG